jgi:hypothetical protein
MPHQGHELQQTSTKKITASPPQAIKNDGNKQQHVGMQQI